MGLTYATGNRGGCHVRGFTVGVEVFGAPVKLDKDATEGKAALVMGAQNGTASLDASGACLISGWGIGPEQYVEMLRTATGVPYDMDSYFKIGERIWNLERLFNLKAGLTRRRRHAAAADAERADPERSVQGLRQPPRRDAAGILQPARVGSRWGSDPGKTRRTGA